MDIQWPLLIFSVLLGFASGSFVFMGIGELRGMFKEVRFLGSLIALVAIAVGGSVSVLHMGHPERATHLLGNLSSGLSIELFMTFATGIMLFIYMLLARRKYPTASKVIGSIGGILGIALPFVTGYSYLMAARPAWDNITLPLLYVGAGLATGFLFMTALVLRSGSKEEGAFALKLSLGGIVLMIVTVLAYLVWVAVAPHQQPSREIARLISGDLASLFWMGVVIIGLVLPLILGFLAHKRGTAILNEGKAALGQVQGLLYAALACSLVGTVFVRAIIYLIGTSVESFFYQ